MVKGAVGFAGYDERTLELITNDASRIEVADDASSLENLVQYRLTYASAVDLDQRRLYGGNISVPRLERHSSARHLCTIWHGTVHVGFAGYDETLELITNDASRIEVADDAASLDKLTNKLVDQFCASGALHGDMRGLT